MFKDTEYKINVEYEIRDAMADCDFSIKFGSALPESGRLAVRLTGNLAETGVFHFSNKTKSVDADNLLTFKFTNIDIGDVRL